MKTETALDNQIGGDHYSKLKIQPMEYSMANELDEILKVCTRCHKNKFLDFFSNQLKARDGKQSICKVCYAEIGRNRRIGKPCINCGKAKEVGIQKGARLCLSCSKFCFVCKENPRKKQHRVCTTCQTVRTKKRNKDDPDERFRYKVNRISSVYRISKEYATALASQKICDACKDTNYLTGKFHIDHCHQTGAVRGVLCFTCNVALGNVQDNISKLENLIEYLKRTSPK